MSKLKEALITATQKTVLFARRSRLFCWDHVGVCSIVLLIVGIVAALSINLTIFSPLKRALDDFAMTDIYYEIERQGEPSYSADIVLVDITALHRRSEIARTLRAINRCGPKVVALDIIFEREGEDLDGNIDITNAISELGPTAVLSCKLTDYDPQTASFGACVRSFFAPFISCYWGYGNVRQVHAGGVIREYTLSQKIKGRHIYSLAYAAACKYEGTQPHPAPDGAGKPIVYGDLDFISLPYYEVESHAALLKDKLVMVGTMSTEEDSHITPMGKMPGLKCQAYSAASILEHRTISNMSPAASILLALLLCYLCAWIGYHIQRLPSPLYLYVSKFYYLGLTCLLAWAAFMLFVRASYNTSLVFPLLSVALVEEARLHYRMLIATLAKRKWGRKLVAHSIYLPK